jgi:DNA polymerase III epsilon subunit-like protein
MGVSARGDSELIRITAADFFSRVVLLDTLVCPSVPMKHYNTKYSGVSAADMRQAVQSQTCVFGRNKARDLLFQHVRPETMVVVHGGPGDLTSLRWIHSRIIDTHLLQSYTGTKTPGGKSLRNLCRVRLDIEVQQQQRHDGQGRPRAGHDSLEDALACRELAIDWLKGIPDT